MQLDVDKLSEDDWLNVNGALSALAAADGIIDIREIHEINQIIRDSSGMIDVDPKESFMKTPPGFIEYVKHFADAEENVRIWLMHKLKSLALSDENLDKKEKSLIDKAKKILITSKAKPNLQKPRIIHLNSPEESTKKDCYRIVDEFKPDFLEGLNKYLTKSQEEIREHLNFTNTFTINESVDYIYREILLENLKDSLDKLNSRLAQRFKESGFNFKRIDIDASITSEKFISRRTQIVKRLGLISKILNGPSAVVSITTLMMAWVALPPLPLLSVAVLSFTGIIHMLRAIFALSERNNEKIDEMVEKLYSYIQDQAKQNAELLSDAWCSHIKSQIHSQLTGKAVKNPGKDIFDWLIMMIDKILDKQSKFMKSLKSLGNRASINKSIPIFSRKN